MFMGRCQKFKLMIKRLSKMPLCKRLAKTCQTSYTTINVRRRKPGTKRGSMTREKETPNEVAFKTGTPCPIINTILKKYRAM